MSQREKRDSICNRVLIPSSTPTLSQSQIMGTQAPSILRKSSVPKSGTLSCRSGLQSIAFNLCTPSGLRFILFLILTGFNTTFWKRVFSALWTSRIYQWKQVFHLEAVFSFNQWFSNYSSGSLRVFMESNWLGGRTWRLSCLFNHRQSKYEIQIPTIPIGKYHSLITCNILLLYLAMASLI